MDETNEFQYFHEYRKLVHSGQVTPLRCHCGSNYTTRLKDGRLALWCSSDDTYTTPGLALQLRVENAVHQLSKEYND